MGIPNGATVSGLDVFGDRKNGAGAAEIKLEIYSDNICPFCYLGYKKLLAAMDQARKEGLPVKFSMQFRPFVLDPTLPVDEPVSKKERYAAKFGDKMAAIFAHMSDKGKAWGIDFVYDGPMRSTFLSHRVLEKAYRQGGEKMQRNIIEAIFSGYFEHQKDVGDHDFLAEVSVNAGLFESVDDFEDFVESGECKKEVCSDIMTAQSMGITGVPFFIINGKYALSGAQEPPAFLEIFRKIACGQCPCKKEAPPALTTPQQALAAQMCPAKV